MNRTILFRGFNQNLNKWIYGNLIVVSNDICFIENENGRISVIPSSVGQYINQKDSNGHMICEGDFLQVGGLVELVSYVDGILCSHSIRIYGEVKIINVYADFDPKVYDSNYFESFKIIGNLFQNPELKLT